MKYTLWENQKENKESKKTEATFEAIMTENFPKLMMSTIPQIWEARRTPNMINTTKSIPRQIIFKLQKNRGQRKLESMLRE